MRQWPRQGAFVSHITIKLDYLTTAEMVQNSSEVNIFQAPCGPPEWLTGEYIEKALQEGLRDPSLKVTLVSIELEEISLITRPLNP